MFQIQTVILSSNLIWLWQLNKDRSKSDSDSGCAFVSANREWVHDLFQPRISHTSPTWTTWILLCVLSVVKPSRLNIICILLPVQWGLEALSPFCKPQQGAGRWWTHIKWLFKFLKRCNLIESLYMSSYLPTVKVFISGWVSLQLTQFNVIVALLLSLLQFIILLNSFLVELRHTVTFYFFLN